MRMRGTGVGLVARLIGTFTLVAALAPASLVAAATAGNASSTTAPGQQEVDQSLLVPTTLDSVFAPYDCRTTPTGVVCSGEHHINDDWALTDLPCDVPLYGRYVQDRYQTRYYDENYLNYLRKFRTRQVDYFSTGPNGPSTATIATDVQYTVSFAVPGDDKTGTVTSTGVLWDVRGNQGPPAFRVVGTLVEPFDAPATFTGVVTVEDATTRYVDAPLDAFINEEAFFGAVCRLATA